MELEASVDEVLHAAIDLINITSQETELLRMLRPNEIAPIMEEKARIASFYTDLLKKVDRRRNAFADLPEDLKDEVRETSDWVKLIVGENARLLRAATDANERMLVAIKEAAEEKYGAEAPTYTAKGAVSGPGRMGRPVTVTLGLDEKSCGRGPSTGH